MSQKVKLLCMTGEELEDAREAGRVFSHRSSCPKCRETAEIMRLRHESNGNEVDLCGECSRALPREYGGVGWLVSEITR